MEMDTVKEKAQEILEIASYIEKLPTEWLVEELVRRGVDRANDWRARSYLLRPRETKEIKNDSEKQHMLVITWRF